MSLVVLDTDVASATLRNRLPDRLRTTLAGHTMCITFVTVGELMKWRVLRSRGPQASADSPAPGARPMKAGLPPVVMPQAASTGSAGEPGCMRKNDASRNR